MDLKVVDKIKRLAIISMFSDDELMERLVLKGGNAMNLIYDIPGNRASLDLDFSMNNEFSEEELNFIDERIKYVLTTIFKTEGYIAFDISFVKRPTHREIDETRKDFWGGYRIEFKIITEKKFNELSGVLNKIRLNSITLTEEQNKIFSIDISKFEFTAYKVEKEFDSYTIYVYSPDMLAIEKLRAICQQMPEYCEIVSSKSQSARARDFYDIFLIIETFMINICNQDNKNLIKIIFDAKRVPIEFIERIKNYRDFHRSDFQSVIDTVKPGTHLESFDYYFDYVLDKIKCLEVLWIK
jgi:predicted nucleotidyltransferase component of viral defense system